MRQYAAAAAGAASLLLLACTTPIRTDCVPEPAPKLDLSLVVREQVEAHLQRIERSNWRRHDRLVELFRAADCADPALVDKPSGVPIPNVSCTLAGASPARIIVGAHFDKASEGQGAADNWSGATLLPSLFASLAVRERRYTFEFVGFSAEEAGLLGSKHFVRALDDGSRSRIRAMVNIDTLGLGPVQVDVANTDPELACYFAVTSELLRVPLARGGGGPGSWSDFKPFKDVGVPVIELTSITLRSVHLLHSRDDRLGAIDLQSYYAAYGLIAAYLVLLDQGLPMAQVVGR